MPGLAAGLFRLVWMVLPPDHGHPQDGPLTTLLLISSTLGWGVRVQDPTAPYWELHGARLPRRHRRWCVLRLHAEHVLLLPQAQCRARPWASRPASATSASPLVQLLTPVPHRLLGARPSSAAARRCTVPGKRAAEVWYQNAAFVWIPLMVLGAVLAWTMLKSVPIKANIRQQFDIFSNQDTWWMTLLYIMTFGTFSGLAAQFGLLMTNLYGTGNTDIVSGTGAARHRPHRRLRRARRREVRLPRPPHRGRRPGRLRPADRPDGRCPLDARLRHRPHRLDRLHDPGADPRHDLGGRPRRRLRPVPLGDARDLPVQPASATPRRSSRCR